MNIAKWEPQFISNPQKHFTLLNRSVQRLFEDFDRNFFKPALSPTQGSFIPAFDINEDKENLYFIAELPGLEPDDVKLTVSEGVLSVRGIKKRKVEHQERSFYKMEQSYGEFVRQFGLPEGIREDDIQADLKNGVLEIVVPKQEPSKPREREVKIGNVIHKAKEILQSNSSDQAQAIPMSKTAMKERLTEATA